MKKYSKSARLQRGMSLVELMISLTVGLFLLAGVVTNFVSTKNADVKRNAISEMDASAQEALSILRQAITHAGYPSVENIKLEKAFFTESDTNPVPNENCRGGSIQRDYEPITKYTKNIGIADILSVVSLADNPCIAGRNSCPDEAGANPRASVYIDCTGGGAQRDAKTVACSTDPERGMINPGEAKIFNTFFLSQSDKTLNCQGSRGGTKSLVGNIYAMQFLYGVTSIDGSKLYLNAAQVENRGLWEVVNSVQVGLLVQSTNSMILDEPSDTAYYILLDNRVNIAKSLRRHLYRIYSTTINLENVNKEPLR